MGRISAPISLAFRQRRGANSWGPGTTPFPFPSAPLVDSSCSRQLGFPRSRLLSRRAGHAVCSCISVVRPCRPFPASASSCSPCVPTAPPSRRHSGDHKNKTFSDRLGSYITVANFLLLLKVGASHALETKGSITTRANGGKRSDTAYVLGEEGTWELETMDREADGFRGTRAAREGSRSFADRRQKPVWFPQGCDRVFLAESKNKDERQEIMTSV